MKIKVGLIGFGRMGQMYWEEMQKRRSMGHRIYLRYPIRTPENWTTKPFPFIQNHI